MIERNLVMRQVRFGVMCVATLVLVTTGWVVRAQEESGDAGTSRRIAIFGSSVANGRADELEQGGYAGRLQTLLGPRGWEVVNVSRGGDSTTRIRSRFRPEGEPDPNVRYLTTAKPGYAVLGLSLGNEGVRSCNGSVDDRCAKTRADAEQVFERYAEGMRWFVAESRAAGIAPVIALCYARADFWPADYAYLRRMNLLINAMDVPSVNLLGAIDDGAGRWAQGFFPDTNHPNAAGHEEIVHAFVPTLFEALEAGKPRPVKSTATTFARVRGADPMPLVFVPEDRIRSFALSFRVRTMGDGTVAGVGGQTLDGRMEWRTQQIGDKAVEFEAMTLMPSERFQAAVSVRDGRWVYSAANGTVVVSPPAAAPGPWHYVTVSHYVARGETLFYVDGALIGTVAERLEPDRFVLGGQGPDGPSAAPAQADYQEWTVHRAALNGDEVAALHAGTLLQASLEVYAPLADAQMTVGQTLENRAQSLSTVKVNAASVSSTQN
jgi:lysophospholipase L1-like esterase